MAKDWRIDMTMDKDLCIEIDSEERYIHRIINHVIYSVTTLETKWALWKIDYDDHGNVRAWVFTDVGILYGILITKEKACIVESGGFPSWFKRFMEYLWARR